MFSFWQKVPNFRGGGTLKRFTHENGALIVPKNGIIHCHIYTQVFFETHFQAGYLNPAMGLT